jgi:hypothetical protein
MLRDELAERKRVCVPDYQRSAAASREQVTGDPFADMKGFASSVHVQGGIVCIAARGIYSSLHWHSNTQNWEQGADV